MVISIIIFAPVGTGVGAWMYCLLKHKLTPTGPDTGRTRLLRLNPFLIEIVTERMSTGFPVGHVLGE